MSFQSPNKHLNNNLIAPPSLRIRLLPRPHRINLKHILAPFTHTDTMQGDRASKQYREKVIFDRATREIRDVQSFFFLTLALHMTRKKRRDK